MLDDAQTSAFDIFFLISEVNNVIISDSMKYTSIFLAEKLTPFPITQITPFYMKWPRNHPTSGDLHVRLLSWYHTV
jgi:hypothetical protein